jgi:hypothetical protein
VWENSFWAILPHVLINSFLAKESTTQKMSLLEQWRNNNFVKNYCTFINETGFQRVPTTANNSLQEFARLRATLGNLDCRHKCLESWYGNRDEELYQDMKKNFEESLSKWSESYNNWVNKAAAEMLHNLELFYTLYCLPECTFVTNATLFASHLHPNYESRQLDRFK